MFAFDCQWLNRLHVGLLGLSLTKKTTAVVVVEAEAATAVVAEAEATAAVVRPLESKAYLRSLKAGGPLGSGSLQ